MSDNALEIIEIARKTGKIRKGCNEVTKLIERSEAKFVVVARDVTPKEIIMHLPLLAAEKGIKYAEVDRKEDLGAAAGLPVGTAAVAVIVEGDAKDLIKNL